MKDLLEGSLKNQDFQVYLQPKVGLKEDSVVGAEALVRWRHPQKGVMLPSDFVPVFERDGSICKLDRYVFEEVCRILSRWREEGRPLFPVSLNLSRCHFQIPDFLSYFERLKRKYQIPDGLIEMELTESVFFQDEDIETVKHTLEKMHRLGFRCSLDDFGSGYSSLGLLKEFEVDAVKLDRSFFADGMRRRGEDVVEGVIALSKKLHLYTVAEGIETKEQVEFLERIRCDAIQGYFYSKPLPVKEFEHWVEKWNHK